MTSAMKLKEKLTAGAINARELRTLLKHEGWVIDRVKGSHEIWIAGSRTYVLATHSKDLKPYQIKEARLLILTEERADGQENV